LQDIRLQDRAIEFLRRSIENQRLSHSLLFFGPEGVGKKLSCLTLAKALNCDIEGPFDSCDKCPSCRKIEALNHPDINWVRPEGAGNIIRIEKIRLMKKRINLKPFEGKIKFSIVESAHLLTEEAANSILKILEEPPKNSIIILVTDDINRIFPTVKSRCQWVLFSSAKPAGLKKLLSEEYNMTEKEAHFLSYLSEGRIGKAIAMKDEETLNWKNEVFDRFTKNNIIFKEDPFFFGNKREKILKMVDILVSCYRDIFILKNGGDTSLLANIDRIEDLKSKAEALSTEKIKEILYETLRIRSYIERNVNPKLALSNLVCITEQQDV